MPFAIGDFYVYNVAKSKVGEETNRSWGRIEFFPYYRLYYILDEKEAFLQLKEKTIQLKSKHLYYIPAEQVVSGKAKMLDHLFIHFVPNFGHFNVIETCRDIIELETSECICELFEIIRQNYKKKETDARFAASGAIQLLLSIILKGQFGNNDKRDKFLPVLDYINVNLDKSLSLGELAEVMGYNKRYFGNLFKEVFTVSPIQYVTNRKMSVACRLLADSNLTIQEIAYQLGFESEFYFSRMFKIKTGKSPKEYRIDIRK